MILVCGLPQRAVTYVREHASKDDIVIDLDLIAREYGLGQIARIRIGDAVNDRNMRLAALSKQPKNKVAWVILMAPTQRLRDWWSNALGAEEVVLLTPTPEELRRRILDDLIGHLSDQSTSLWSTSGITERLTKQRRGCDHDRHRRNWTISLIVTGSVVFDGPNGVPGGGNDVTVDRQRWPQLPVPMCLSAKGSPGPRCWRR